MTTTWGPLPPARILSGDEPIPGADARLRDFWAWAYSDLRANTVRPMLAESSSPARSEPTRGRGSSGTPTTS